MEAASEATEESEAEETTSSKSGRKVSVSQLIRDYLDENPDAKPKEGVAALAAQGVRVETQYFSTVKNNWKTKRAATGGSDLSGAGSRVTVDQLLRAKALADQLGGVDSLRKALDALERLR